MRITNYRIELDDEDRRTVLVKECAKNSIGISSEVETIQIKHLVSQIMLIKELMLAYK